MRPRPTRIALVLALLTLSSCQFFGTHSPRVSVLPPVNPAPVANSPANAVKRLMSCWPNRDAATYGDVFTDDYAGIAAATDSAGNPYRDRRWTREDELASAQHLFVGGGSNPAASNILLDYDNVLVTQPDPRPGKTFRWHQVIRLSMNMKVTIPDVPNTSAVIPLSGNALFYLVRGDSAAIPADLAAQGVRADSTRWYVERWEDETAGFLGASPQRGRRAGTMPTQQMSWFGLKTLCR